MDTDDSTLYTWTTTASEITATLIKELQTALELVASNKIHWTSNKMHWTSNKILNTLNKNITATCYVSWAEIKDPRNVPYSQKAYFSKMFSTNLITSLLVSISPLPRWSIHLRSWLNSLHVVLGIIKGYSKMCGFVTQHNYHRCLKECAIGMLTAGMSTRAVAREFHINFSSISLLQHRFGEFGSTSNQPYNCRPLSRLGLSILCFLYYFVQARVWHGVIVLSYWGFCRHWDCGWLGVCLV
jgi:hypothetical protein